VDGEQIEDRGWTGKGHLVEIVSNHEQFKNKCTLYLTPPCGLFFIHREIIDTIMYI
jgi:hypothetical protein